MVKFLAGLFLFFISIMGNAQEIINEKEIGYRKLMNILMKEQINQLKDGAILVRLQTKNNSIAALRKIGKSERANKRKNKLADKIEKRQKKFNLKIVTAFKEKFNFCPAYFFFSDYSQNVRDKQFDKVVFLNDSLLADTTIKFTFTFFLTAEFGIIEQDTAKYFSHYSNEPEKNWSLKTVRNYYSGTNMGFGALLVKSDQFIQLRRPFPYYVRTFDSLPINRKPNKVVAKMNRQLIKFYKRKNKQSDIGEQEK